MKTSHATIRLSQAGDYDAVVKLGYAHMTLEKKQSYLRINPKAAERFKNQIMGSDGVCFFAILDDKCVGYVVGSIKSDSLSTVTFAELETIVVQSDYRSRGIGSLLAKRFLLWSKEVHVERVSVKAGSRNAAAINFYERFGFIPSSLELELNL